MSKRATTGWFAAALLFAAASLLTAAGGDDSGDEQPVLDTGTFKVLVFSKTAGFRHKAQIPAGHKLIAELGKAHGFEVQSTEEAGVFTDEGLKGVDVVVFLNTTGDVLDDTQQKAFERFIRGGGGFVGVHAAADTEYDWPFYGELVGAYFAGHPKVQTASLDRTAADHPSTAHLPKRFEHEDEWYNFRTDPAANKNITVLLTLDESTYNPGKKGMGESHPIAWCQNIAGGRSWYTGLGHTMHTYERDWFKRHLLGGVRWAAERPEPSLPVTPEPEPDPVP